MKLNGKKQYILNIFIILTITIISVYFSIRNNYKQVFEVIRHTNILWVIVMILLMICYYSLDGLSTMWFGKVYKKDYSFKQAFINSLSGVFFSAITPSSSGGQFAQIFVFSKQGINAANSSSILLMCFICYQSVLVLYTSILVLFNLSFLLSNPAIFSLVMIGFLVNFIVIFVLFGGAKSKKLQNFLVYKVIRFLNKIKIIRDYDRVSHKTINYLTEFRKELDYLSHHKVVLTRSIICNILKLTIVFSLPFFASKAVHLNVSITQIFKFISYCSFIYLINAFLPIPGASGGSEACYMILFSFLGSVGASSSMTLWRFISYYIGLILGGIIFSFNKEVNEMKKDME